MHSSMSALVAVAAAAVLGVVVAKPTEFTPGAMDLSAVLNRTTCPIVVDFDYDETRIPKRIKILKCGNDPLEHCRMKSVPESECCHSGRDDVHMACVEIQDLVQVYYPQQKHQQTHTISVGCSCVMEQVQPAQSFSPS